MKYVIVITLKEIMSCLSLSPHQVIKSGVPSILWFCIFCVSMLSCSVMSDSLWSNGLQTARLLCPWDFPGKNTGMACYFLLQGIFSTHGSNSPLLHPLHRQAESLPLEPTRKPTNGRQNINILIKPLRQKSKAIFFNYFLFSQ